MDNETLYAWVGCLPHPHRDGFILFAPVIGVDREEVARRREETDHLVLTTGCEMRLMRFTGCTDVSDGNVGVLDDPAEPEQMAA